MAHFPQHHSDAFIISSVAGDLPCTNLGSSDNQDAIFHNWTQGWSSLPLTAPSRASRQVDTDDEDETDANPSWIELPPNILYGLCFKDAVEWIAVPGRLVR